MSGGQHGVPHPAGSPHPSEAMRRLGVALIGLVAAVFAWYWLTATVGEVFALFSWAHPGRDAPPTTWDLAGLALILSALVAVIPAAAVLGAAAVARLKHADAVAGLALAGFTAATVTLWLVR